MASRGGNEGCIVTLEDGRELFIPSGVSIAILGVAGDLSDHQLHIYQDDSVKPSGNVSMKILITEESYPYAELTRSGDLHEFVLPHTDVQTTGVKKVALAK